MAYANGHAPMIGDFVCGPVGDTVILGQVISLERHGGTDCRVAFARVRQLPVIEPDSDASAWMKVFADTGILSKLVATEIGVVALIGAHAHAKTDSMKLVMRQDGSVP